MIPTCLCLCRVCCPPRRRFQRGRCLSSSGGKVEPPKQFPNRCFSRASSIEDSLFTSGKMKTATSPRPLQHKTTRQANQCLRGRTGHRGEGKAEAEPPSQENTGCGNISPKAATKIKDSKLLSQNLSRDLTSIVTVYEALDERTPNLDFKLARIVRPCTEFTSSAVRRKIDCHCYYGV